MGTHPALEHDLPVNEFLQLRGPPLSPWQESTPGDPAHIIVSRTDLK